MYYEARTHELKQVANAMEAATMIKTGEDLYSYHCLQFQAANKTITIVPDGHIDNVFSEVAVLETREGGYYQIESITAAWVKTPKELAKYFTDAAKEPCTMGKAALIIGAPKGNETAWFECGCCGNGFKGNVKAQQKFDQDAGYGICKNCEHYYR